MRGQSALVLEIQLKVRIKGELQKQYMQLQKPVLSLGKIIWWGHYSSFYYQTTADCHVIFSPLILLSIAENDDILKITI